MSAIEFIKLHGAGNDFIFLDTREWPEGRLDASLARTLCHRNFGIGADGVLSLCSVEDGKPRMRIHNADGSIPEMCGNGIRCFVKVLAQRLGFVENPIRVLTDAGEKTCRWREDAGETWVAVEMGAVSTLDGSRLLEKPGEHLELEVDGERLLLHTASTGNPHAALFGEFSSADIARLGPTLSRHPAFPDGANVEFCQILTSRTARLVVHERGVGLTLACGTGAVASTAAAVASGRLPADEEIRVTLPGGDLLITIAQDFTHTTMEGPAAEVFSGTLNLQESG